MPTTDDWHLRQLARTLAAQDRRLYALETTNQLGRSSLDPGGFVPEFTPNGSVGSVWGEQDDGSHGVVIFDGPVPAIPTQPAVETFSAGLSVTWDGRLVRDGEPGPIPHDFEQVEIFARLGEAPVVDAFASHRLGSITATGGGTKSIAPLDSGEWHVCIRSRSIPGRTSDLTVPVVVTVTGLADAIGAVVDEYAEQIADDLAELDQRLIDARTALDALEGTTVPALQAQITTLQTVTIPALNDALDDATTDLAATEAALDNLTTVTLPALQADLAALEGTIIPALNGEIAALEAAQADLATRTDTLETVAVPALEDDIATLTGTTLPALDAALSAAQSDITAAAGAASAAQSTANTANALASTADGRITVASASPTTANATGKAIGSVWEVRSGGVTLRRYVLTGATTWTQVRAGQDFIGDKAIGTAQIGDLAVGTAQIALLAVTDAQVGNLSVGKLVAGSTDVNTLVAQKIAVAVATIIELNADRITAGKINTARLDAETIAAAVGSFLNLNASQITAGTLDVARLNATAVAAAVATVINLNASRITAGTIDVARLNATNVAAHIANVISLNASRITAGTIDTARLNASSVAAAVATFLTLNADQITTGTLATARLDAVSVAAHVGSFIEADVSKLVAGTGTIGQAVVDKLWAQVITARKITADMVLIGGGSNLVPNGMGEMGSNAGWPETVTFSTTDPPPGVAGYFNLPAVRTVVQTTNAFPVSPDTDYLLEVWLKSSKADSRIYIEARDQNNANAGISAPAAIPGEPYASSGFHLVSNLIVPTTWVKYCAKIHTTATARTLRTSGIYTNHNYGSTTDAVQSIAIRIRPMVDSPSLIVDGSILARHIDVVSLTAASAFVERVRALGIELVDEEGQVAVNLTGVGSQSLTILKGGAPALTLDDEGRMTARVASASESLYVRGTEVADLISANGRMLYKSELSTTITGIKDSWYGIVEARFEVPADRMIRFDFGALFYPTGGEAQFKIVAASAAPTISSSTVLSGQWGAVRASNYDPKVFVHLVRQQDFTTLTGISPGATARVLLCVMRGSAANLRVQPGLQTYLYVSDGGPSITVDSNHNSGGGALASGSSTQTSAVQTYTTTWAATAHRSYINDGGGYDGGQQGLDNAMQGYSSYTASKGRQASLIFFDSAAIRAALSGATIQAVSVYVKNKSFFYGSGGTARIYRHNQDPPGGTAISGTNLVAMGDHGMARGEGRWIEMPTSFAEALKAGTARGYGFLAGGSSAGEYYGQFEAAPAKISIRYRK